MPESFLNSSMIQVPFFLLWGMAGASSALTAYLMPKVEEDPDL